MFRGLDQSAHGIQITFSFLLQLFGFVHRTAKTTPVVIRRERRVAIFCEKIANLFKKGLSPYQEGNTNTSGSGLEEEAR
jgi:hypothetical protein